MRRPDPEPRQLGDDREVGPDAGADHSVALSSRVRSIAALAGARPPFDLDSSPAHGVALIDEDPQLVPDIVAFLELAL